MAIPSYERVGVVGLNREAVAVLLAAIKNPTKHVYWGAGEPDCPKDIKARNGELHTIRCKKCDDPKAAVCIG